MALSLITYATTATPQVLTSIPPQATAQALAGTVAGILRNAGWSPAATLPNGYRLLGISPQQYSVLLEVTWQTVGIGPTNNAIGWQLKSAVGSGAVGVLDFSYFNNTYPYTLVASPCGLFFSRPNIDDSAIVCGVPYDPYGSIGSPQPSPPNECNMGTQVATELWYMFGNLTNIGGILTSSVVNPRQSLGLDLGSAASGSKAYAQNCACANGVVIVGNGQPGDPQIFQLSSTFDEGFSFPSGVSQPLWWSGADFLYPSFVGWGATLATPALVRGQLYNCANRTGKYALERQQSWDGFTWVNFTDEYFFGSLWPMISTSAVGNWSW